MNVIAFDPFITDAKVFEADGVKKVDSIEEPLCTGRLPVAAYPRYRADQEIDRPQVVDFDA